MGAPIAVLAAATNEALIRRRHNNALNTTCPLQYDTAKTIASILNSVSATATALWTSAERDEDFIYTHYEGWLPDDDERPTTLWATAWGPITRDTYPKASTSLTINNHGAAHDPTPDPNDPAVAARIRQRTQFSY